MTSPARAELVRLSVVTAARALLVAVVGGAALVAAGSSRSGGSTAAGDGWWLGATVLVAAAVMASRRPVERLADRVAYGPGGDPYSALSAFVQRVAETVAVEEVLPRVAQTVTQATHGSTGEVRLRLTGGAELREAWPAGHGPGPRAGTTAGTMVHVPLQRRGEQVGSLGVTTEAVETDAHTRAVLDRLAGAAGLALANVRLTYDLRHRIAESRDLAERLAGSRRRLVGVAAEQTARFSRLVDDHVQSRLRAAGDALDRATPGDAAALEDAAAEAASALEALREIAHGVFPPTLADNGLRVALETYAGRHGGRVRVTHGGHDARAPEPVETAGYLCAVQLLDECLDGGGSAEVALERLDHRLEVTVSCDRPPTPGTVQLVEDRVDATGGRVRLPADDGTTGDGTTGDGTTGDGTTGDGTTAAAHVLSIGWEVPSP